MRLIATSSGEGSARRRPVLWLGVVALVLLLVAFGLYVRGGGPLPGALSRLATRGHDPLAASGPEERALRLLRLAGIERAVVGEGSGAVVVRIELPSIRTSADVEFASQVGFSACAESFPKAGYYVVQLFAPDAVPLIELKAEGDAVRRAVTDNDADALKSAAVVRYLSTQEAAR